MIEIILWWLLGFLSFPIAAMGWKLYKQMIVWFKLYKSAREMEKSLNLKEL